MPDQNDSTGPDSLADLITDENEDNDQDPDAPTDGADPDEDDLGDKGKQALDRMKDRLKAERARRVAAERERDEARGDDENTRAARDAEKKALAKANDRIVRSEVKAAAKGVLADPADAYRFLDISQFEVDDDGNVDEDEIADAIRGLLDTKPYLAAQGDRSPRPDRSQGPRGGTAAKTGADGFAATLERMGF